MEQYKYSVEMRYNDKKTMTARLIREEYIKSIIIDRDYKNNNMPMIFVDISLSKKLLDDMKLNAATNFITLTIYKFIDNTTTQKIKTKYFQDRFAYFIQDDVNYQDSLDMLNDDTKENEDAYKNITIGLMKIDNINDNKKSFNTVLKNTTMINAVHYATSHMKMVIEKFDYNDTLRELILEPTQSVSKTIQYLNSVKVFYSTPYRFFIDFDCTYLLSSRGKHVPKKGEGLGVVLIVIRDPLDQQANATGMITNKAQGNYQIDINALDSNIYIDRVTEKGYTSITGVTTNEGVVGNTKLNINKSEYSTDKASIVRLPNNNANMLKNIQASANSSSTRISINKNDLDSSIFTLNKRYLFRNYDKYSDKDGDFLLTRKRELFIREDDSFVMNTMMNFEQVG